MALPPACLQGGGVSAVNGRLLIQNTTMRGCRAGIEGGCLLLLDNAELLVVDSAFDKCTSLVGGAVAVERGASVLPRFDASLTRTTFSSNVATGGDGGAALYCGDSTGNFSLLDVAFVNNEALARGASGGAVVMKGASMRITRGTFASNAAGNHGGCVVLDNAATVRFDDSSFVNNTAGVAGGAVFVTAEAAAVVVGSRFVSNLALRGGAVAADLQSRVRLANCSMRGNDAEETGGAIELVGAARLTMT
eukprot:jgi/Mesen1/10302/ME000079S09726